MLQPILVRPFFRVILVPLALAIGGAGIGALIVAVSGVRSGFWPAAFLVFAFVGAVSVASLGLILAATGALPEWVVGDGGGGEDSSAAP